MENFELIKEIGEIIITYVIPILSLIVSIVAIIKSNETVKVKVQLSEVEEKLKQYDLKIKEYELANLRKQEEKVSMVEARAITVAPGKHRLKIWNSGNTSVYDVDVEIVEKNSVILMKDNAPFEYLEPKDGFEEILVSYDGAASKFHVTITWKDENGVEKSNTQLRTI